MTPVKLDRSFYDRDDVTLISKELLGKVLCTKINGMYTSGLIVETEAYRWYDDKASHSCAYGKTDRTKVIFGEPGFAYVYLCYGIHHLFNVVTNKPGKADAILIRAIEPIDGIDLIMKRRNKSKIKRDLGGGPGIASQALGITTRNYGTDLTKDRIWIEDRSITIPQDSILATPRVGVDYAGEDAFLPWRFRIKDNPFTSPAG